MVSQVCAYFIGFYVNLIVNWSINSLFVDFGLKLTLGKYDVAVL